MTADQLLKELVTAIDKFKSEPYQDVDGDWVSIYVRIKTIKPQLDAAKKYLQDQAEKENVPENVEFRMRIEKLEAAVGKLDQRTCGLIRG